MPLRTVLGRDFLRCTTYCGCWPMTGVSGRYYVGPLRLNNDDLQQPSFWALPPSHPSHSIFHLTTIGKTYLREIIKSMKLNKRRVKTGAWSVLRGAHSHLGYHLALFDPLIRDRHSSFISYNFFSGPPLIFVL